MKFDMKFDAMKDFKDSVMLSEYESYKQIVGYLRDTTD